MYAVSEPLSSLICRLYESLGIWITSIVFGAISRFSSKQSVLFDPLKNTLTLLIYFDGAESATFFMEQNKAGSKRPLSFSMDHILAKNNSHSDRDRVSKLSETDDGNSDVDTRKIPKLSPGKIPRCANASLSKWDPNEPPLFPNLMWSAFHLVANKNHIVMTPERRSIQLVSLLNIQLDSKTLHRHSTNLVSLFRSKLFWWRS